MRTTVIRFAKFSGNIKELRLHFCQTGEASKGAREYVQRYYPSLKKDNPDLPILIRECSGIQPRLWARYGMGKETSVSLTNLGPDDVRKNVEAMGGSR
ncbi:NADH dehydrogenase (ubiquinone) B8 subunit [Glossina fuscipes fuscipes]